jgi:hypothetical protein
MQGGDWAQTSTVLIAQGEVKKKFLEVSYAEFKQLLGDTGPDTLQTGDIGYRGV